MLLFSFLFFIFFCLYQLLVQELAAEKVRLRRAQKELRKQHKQLGRDKKAKEQLLADLDARAHDVQARATQHCDTCVLHVSLALWAHVCSDAQWTMLGEIYNVFDLVIYCIARQSICAHMRMLQCDVQQGVRRYCVLQMLKFGREINMDLLDRLGPSPGADDLAAQLADQERRFAAELKDWDRKVAGRTEELVALTQENTAHLQTVASLTAQQKDLEDGVRKTQRELHADPIATRRREVAEREHLVQAVNAQAKEIEQLRLQINVLRRKDTSVYS